MKFPGIPAACWFLVMALAGLSPARAQQPYPSYPYRDASDWMRQRDRTYQDPVLLGRFWMLNDPFQVPLPQVAKPPAATPAVPANDSLSVLDQEAREQEQRRRRISACRQFVQSAMRDDKRPVSLVLQDHKRFDGLITAVSEEEFVIQEDASRPAHAVRYDELKQCGLVPPPRDLLAPTRFFVQAAMRDDKHRVRVVLQNHKHLKGRILSASADEFSIQEAATKPVLTLQYAEVSRVDILPTAGERAGEVAGVLLLIPLFPLFLLAGLAGWDGC
jgi:hypothetical protein